VAWAHIGIWRVYRRQGKVVEAKNKWNYAWNVDKQVATEYGVINGLELECAAGVFERMVGEEPRNWYTRANLGIAYLKMGRHEQPC